MRIAICTDCRGSGDMEYTLDAFVARNCESCAGAGVVAQCEICRDACEPDISPNRLFGLNLCKECKEECRNERRNNMG